MHCYSQSLTVNFCINWKHSVCVANYNCTLQRQMFYGIRPQYFYFALVSTKFKLSLSVS